MATSIDITPLSGSLGARVTGVDLSRELGDAQFAEIKSAFLTYLVLYFPDQVLPRERHTELGRRFGELHIHPAAPSPEGFPEIMPIETDARSSHNPREVARGSRAVNGDNWHSDVSCDEEPPLGSLLHIKEVPPAGGDTLFANMYAAYESLSAPLRVLLNGLTATHSGERQYIHQYGRGKAKDRSAQGYRNGTDYPQAVHPVVRTHPETGRRALYVNRMFTQAINELEAAESDALLALLFAHIERPEIQCRLTWQANGLAIWDNRATQHYAIFDFYPHRRRGERVTVKGDRPFFEDDSHRRTSTPPRTRLAATR